jgi:hypothetical protein
MGAYFERARLPPGSAQRSAMRSRVPIIDAADSSVEGSPLSLREGSKGTKRNGRAWTRPDRWAPYFQWENVDVPPAPSGGGSARSGFDSRRLHFRTVTLDGVTLPPLLPPVDR